jgi:hypothetical protein
MLRLGQFVDISADGLRLDQVTSDADLSVDEKNRS